MEESQNIYFNLSILLTIKYFSPAHTIIIIVIGKTAPSIINLINFEGKISDIVSLIALLVIFIILLIFNEVIELNCFKLQKNTVKNIQERAANETLQDNKNDDDLGLNENEEIEE